MSVSGAPASHIDLSNSSVGFHGCPHDSLTADPSWHFQVPASLNPDGHNTAIVLTPCPERDPACHDTHAAADVRSRVPRTKVKLRPRRELCREASAEEVCDELQEESGDDHGDRVHSQARTVLHLFATGLFSFSCSTLPRDDGIIVEAIAGKSEQYGDLMDDYSWGVMAEVLLSDVIDAVLITPPSGTYTSQATTVLPALRADSGQEWFGCRGLPNGLSSALRDEDLVWLRVAETLLSLTKQGRVWTVAFEVLSDVMPTQLLGMTEAPEDDDVERQLVNIRCITIMCITSGWTYIRLASTLISRSYTWI